MWWGCRRGQLGAATGLGPDEIDTEAGACALNIANTMRSLLLLTLSFLAPGMSKQTNILTKHCNCFPKTLALVRSSQISDTQCTTVLS